MYKNEADEEEWRKSQDEKRAEVSQDNPRDIVEMIDWWITLRIQQHEALKGLSEGISTTAEESIEVLKRRITDYLLVTDPRAGVFRKPE